MFKLHVSIHRYTILLVSLCVALCCLAGAIGYFWGKRSVAEAFVRHCCDETFADHVSAAFCTLYDQEEQPAEEDGDRSAQSTPARAEAEEDDAEGADEEEEGGVQEADTVAGERAHKYRAYLAGFGSKKTAEHYARRLNATGLAAAVVERTTRGSKRVHTWYQVVTMWLPYDELSTILEALKKRDKLTGIVIEEEKEAS